jgi:hypothetical protein
VAGQVLGARHRPARPGHVGDHPQARVAVVARPILFVPQETHGRRRVEGSGRQIGRLRRRGPQAAGCQRVEGAHAPALDAGKRIRGIVAAVEHPVPLPEAHIYGSGHHVQARGLVVDNPADMITQRELIE